MAEPAPTWGSMLTAIYLFSVLVSHWGMLIPGLALIPVFLAYVLLASELRPRGRPLVHDRGCVL